MIFFKTYLIRGSFATRSQKPQQVLLRLSTILPKHCLFKDLGEYKIKITRNLGEVTYKIIIKFIWPKKSNLTRAGRHQL